MSAVGVSSSWTPLLLLLSLENVRAAEFGLHQTVPVGGTVCPGQMLQYTCTSTLSEQYWTIGTSYPFIITESSLVNSSGTIDDFFLILAAKDADCSICTATNDIVTSKYDGQQVACYSGNSFSNVTIAVADKPADCSSNSVFPTCYATTNAVGDIVLSVTLSNPNSLDCVERFQIHYNGENETVSLSYPTAQFTFSYKGGQPVQNEIVVHTLDYENRTGDLPCTFSIVELNAVGKFLEPECSYTSSQNVDVTFHWVSAAVGGCLEGDAQLHYIVEFNDSRFSNGQETSTTYTSYTATNITRETVVEITVSPSSPLLGLTGPASSKTVNLASVSCSPWSPEEVTSSTSPTDMIGSELSSIPAFSAALPVHYSETVTSAITVLLALLMVAV